jgi:ribosomal protein L40E
MVKKTLGYVELEWTCPSCNARNPGTAEVCQSCGTKMPEDVAFELPAKQELDTSAETASRVAVGPDIHCPYCGARNIGSARVCTKCGGDLSEGARRKKGEKLGAFETGPVPDVTCPHCGTDNPASATKCAACGGNLERERPQKAPIVPTAKRSLSPLVVGIVLLALAGCVLGAFFLLRGSSESVALVREVEWTYAIQIEELGPVTREAWRDDVPAGAKLGSCESREHHVQDEPAANATEVCGTPYAQDTGTGQGQVVQDCRYHVYQDWCEYTVNAWRPAGEEVSSGRDLDPVWPVLNLTSNQRELGRSEDYEVVFDADGKDHVYSPSTLERFRRFEIGSEWIVETNALGGVTSVRPAD